MCGALLHEGRKGPQAAHVDHVRPLELDPARGMDRTNLLSVCASPCHNGTCAAIEARHAGDADAIERAKRAWRPVGLDGYRAD